MQNKSRTTWHAIPVSRGVLLYMIHALIEKWCDVIAIRGATCGDYILTERELGKDQVTLVSDIISSKLKKVDQNYKRCC